jgi:RNA polymerase sigma-70 factor (ECF subfamily)
LVLKAQNARSLAPLASHEKPEEKRRLRELARDDAAFWEMWAIYQQQIFFICLRYMGNAHADAEDALSQIRERARDTFPRAVAGVRNPKAWLIRVAINQCIDIQRGQQRHQRRTIHLEAAEAGDLCAAVAHEVHPRHCLVLSELKAAVNRAIEALPARIRAASALYFLEERSHQEVATALNISYANARKRIQQARTILRRSFDYRDDFTFFEITP